MSRKDHLLKEFYEVKNFLIHFLRHPIMEIKNVPDWHWYRLIGVHCALSALAGALGGLVDKKFSFLIIAGFFYKPILTLTSLAIGTLFFYYIFQIFLQKTVSIRRLFTLVMLASIPQLLFEIVSGYVPPISLVGMAFTALLLLVGFSENFQIEKKFVVRILSGLYALFFLLWVWQRVNSARMEQTWNLERHIAPKVELGK